MADLKLLTERVIEKEKSAVHQQLTEAKENAQETLERVEQEAEVEKEERKKQIDARLKREYEISKNTLNVKKRNETLAVKQRILSKSFIDAYDMLRNMKSQTTQTFLKKVLEQFQGQGQIVLILGEETKQKVDQNWLENLAVEGTSVSVSEDSIKGKAGAVIAKEGIEYNYLFDALIEDTKGNLIQDVSRQLFQ